MTTNAESHCPWGRKNSTRVCGLATSWLMTGTLASSSRCGGALNSKSPKDPPDGKARFGPRRLRSITQAEVAQWREALGLRVGRRTVLAAFQMPSTLFEHARHFGWAVRNACGFIHAPGATPPIVGSPILQAIRKARSAIQ